jgi:CubicO group peptidase (beta-lactamase class C family)
MDGKRLLLPRSVNMMTTNQLPPEALPITLGGFPLPGCGIGLGTLVRMEGQTPRPTDGEYSWYGAASTCFWVAPKTQLVVVLLQQVEPISVELQMALKPVIEATIQ